MLSLVNRMCCLFLVLLLGGCRDPYNVKADRKVPALLVVEGNIDNTSADTWFRLSLTSGVRDSSKADPAVSGATVAIEDKDHFSYPLSERTNGRYEAYLPQLRVGERYRLRVITHAGRQYLSDEVTLLDNPPIDSVSWERTEKGVTIYVNTHDPSAAARYFRWSFDQVYEFHGSISRYMFTSPRSVGPRPSPDPIYYCWHYDTTATIFTGSSVKLNTALIYNYPLVFIEANSEPLAVKYRIHVKQYALSRDAYDFFNLMKKNTESLGTVFDPLPTEIPSNIHCVSDPEEKVVGFVTATRMQEQVRFIRHEELPGWNYQHLCYAVHVGNTPDSLQGAYYGGLTPLDVDHNNGGYLMSATECVDCTVRGSNVRPLFW